MSGVLCGLPVGFCHQQSNSYSAVNLYLVPAGLLGFAYVNPRLVVDYICSAVFQNQHEALLEGND